ncbi:MAG: radical SAM protein [Polyangiaceae bacterium]|nr:radical SAM protein [Polyangiaceae bacterium]
MRRIELGFHCNNACRFCAPGTLRTELPQHELAAIEREVSSIQTGDRVAFVGGEPTLLEGLPGWATLARERGAWSVMVQTNGRRLSEAGYAHSLVAGGVDVLDVSLHGANEAMHDYHTTIEGSFRETVLGLRRARAAGLTFGITTVVTRSNYRHLPEIVHVAHTLGARAIHLALVEAVGDAARCADQLVPPRELAEPFLARASARARSLGLVAVLGGDLAQTGAPRTFAGRGRAEEPVGGERRHLPVAPPSGE